MRFQPLVFAVTIGLFAAASMAQSVNIDFGSAGSPPDDCAVGIADLLIPLNNWTGNGS